MDIDRYCTKNTGYVHLASRPQTEKRITIYGRIFYIRLHLHVYFLTYIRVWNTITRVNGSVCSGFRYVQGVEVTVNRTRAKKSSNQDNADSFLPLKRNVRVLFAWILKPSQRYLSTRRNYVRVEHFTLILPIWLFVLCDIITAASVNTRDLMNQAYRQFSNFVCFLELSRRTTMASQIINRTKYKEQLFHR